MGTLKTKAQNILTEKNTKIIPENIKKGVTIFDISGSLESGAKLNIYTQTTEPSGKDGIWLDTNKSFNTIYAGATGTVDTWDTNKMSDLGVIPFSVYRGFSKKVGNIIYLFSGSNVYKYQIDTDTYTQLATPPINISHAVGFDTVAYIFNGSTAYKYDYELNSYTQIEDVPRSDYEMVGSYGNYLYFFGYGIRLYKLDTSTDTYIDTNNSSIYASGGYCVTVGEYIYIFGSVGGDSRAQKVNAINLSSSYIASPPIKYSYFSMVAVDNYIYIFGGSWSSTYTPKVCKYDIVNNNYTSLTSYSSGVTGGACVNIGEFIYEFLGTTVIVLRVKSGNFPANSIIILQNGQNTYNSKIIDSSIENFKYYFDGVGYTNDNAELLNTIDTYIGNGTSWVQIT